MKQSFWLNVPLAFSLLYLLAVFSPEANARQSDLEAKENLVSFVPNIVSSGQQDCQGLRINSLLVATSPSCVQKIRKTLKREQHIGILSTKENIIGSLSPCNKSFPVQIVDTSFLVVMHSSDEYRSSPTYYTSEYLPERTFAYFLDEQNSLSDEEVFLTYQNSFHKKGHLAFESDKLLPEGSPVYDEKGGVVCLITSESECRTFPNSLTQPVKWNDFNISIDTPSLIVVILGGAFFVALKYGRASMLKAGVFMAISIFSVIWTKLFTRPEIVCSLTGGCNSGSCQCH